MEEQLEKLRPNAFAIAYRMLGSVADAEDIVQESLLRLHQVLEHDSITSPEAYLATIVTRLCIDELRSARVQRETYIGEWLPEPLVNERAVDASSRAELAESLRMAFLVLLETLSPEQRAVFLLRDVFSYEYSDIAAMLGKSEAACRQIAVRARSHVNARRPRFESRPEHHDTLVDRFFRAIDNGDLAALEAVLVEDVGLHGDGGGRVPALAQPVTGRERVARTLLGWWRAGTRAGGFTVQRTFVNRQPGALIRSREGAVVAVWAIDVTGDGIVAVRSIVNPEKLRHIPESGNLREWLQHGQRH